MYSRKNSLAGLVLILAASPLMMGQGCIPPDPTPDVPTPTGPGSQTLTIMLPGDVPLVLVEIPAGTFQMGDISGVGWSDERPVHTVTITRPFYMGKYPVTQAQWRAVMGTNPSRFIGDNRPVDNVSWDDCQTFCVKVETLTGYTLRLPTEAEWEYACRAGTTTDYSFGNDAARLGQYAWYDANAGDQTHSVGGKLPNAWGLYDMHGNIWEWCEDWHGEYSATAQTDPQGPVSGTSRVIRGGSYSSSAGNSRSASRNNANPGNRHNNVGFRVVCGDSATTPPSDPSPDVPPPSDPDPDLPPPVSGETLTIMLPGGVPLEMALIPTGTFQMGDISGVGWSDERPVHTVTITRPFYMGKYPVTQAQWRAVMGTNPSRFIGDNRPVERVSWSTCQHFCAAVHGWTGHAVRLPTEAEWEYACRAGTKTDYYFGNDAARLGQYAWYYGNSGGQTHDVGGKLPNAWGLYDMHGNVWEWCADRWGAYSAEAQIDPQGPVHEVDLGDYPDWYDPFPDRVLRGGAWDRLASVSRSAARNLGTPGLPTDGINYPLGDIGFRVALGVIEP